ncbi:hypothetical protein BESB_021620 [Besnoitia besnoiti]|uniref:Uncharacterized protein n=1 Tax=Besnoitia besnoiti TaxID=94643 RepID=A0A2A9M7E6_BESBE|nr:hypothetical protein BESB_021620 [Besnoitia besnoiti]PFH32221.1 hypothetical protein BESB_021620 [Besnoitia besnoiti]
MLTTYELVRDLCSKRHVKRAPPSVYVISNYNSREDVLFARGVLQRVGCERPCQHPAELVEDTFLSGPRREDAILRPTESPVLHLITDARDTPPLASSDRKAKTSERPAATDERSTPWWRRAWSERKVLFRDRAANDGQSPELNDNRRLFLEGRGRGSNRIRTAKYSVWSFLPLVLLYQVERFSNCYFLLCAFLQVVSEISPTGGVPVKLISIGMIFGISIIKELFEDLGRHRSDDQENSYVVTAFDGGKLVQKKWKDIVVGDVVKVRAGEYFPADLVLLHCSNEFGICNVETKHVDGESNVKSKFALPQLADYFRNEELAATTKVEVICEPPSDDLARFSAKVLLPPLYVAGAQVPPPEHPREEVSLTFKQLLLRGTSVVETAWAYGLVVYAGHHTRLMKNGNVEARQKWSRLERIYNNHVVLLVAVQLLAVAVHCFTGLRWLNETGDKSWYLLFDKTKGLAYYFAIDFGTTFLNMSGFVPMDLYMLWELSRMAHGIFIYFDDSLIAYDSGARASSHASHLVEEMGGVTHVYSDKTGTLTKNVMQLQCIGLGMDYDFGLQQWCEAKARSVTRDKHHRTSLEQLRVSTSRRTSTLLSSDEGRKVTASRRVFLRTEAGPCVSLDRDMIATVVEASPPKFRETFEHFFLVLALCHTVLVRRQDAGNAEQGNEPAPLSSQETPGTLLSRLRLPFRQKVHQSRRPTECTDLLVNCIAQSDNVSDRAADSPAGGSGYTVPPCSAHTPQNGMPASSVKDKAAETKKVEWTDDGCDLRLTSLQAERPTYDASSPDELALVSTAQYLGLEFAARRNLFEVELHITSSIAADTLLPPKQAREAREWMSGRRKPGRHGKECTPDEREEGDSTAVVPVLKYEILDVLEFDFVRKRMSVITRDPATGRFLLLTKGADTHMIQVAAADQGAFLAEVERQVHDFATAGLRTLVMGYRELSEEEFSTFHRAFVSAQQVTGDRQEDVIRECISTIEVDLKILGCTGIEDILQDEAEDVIKDIKDAGVALWVLTGDKLETAINIGYSTNILNEACYNAVVDGETVEEVQHQLELHQGHADIGRSLANRVDVPWHRRLRRSEHSTWWNEIAWHELGRSPDAELRRMVDDEIRNPTARRDQISASPHSSAVTARQTSNRAGVLPLRNTDIGGVRHGDEQSASGSADKAHHNGSICVPQDPLSSGLVLDESRLGGRLSIHKLPLRSHSPTLEAPPAVVAVHRPDMTAENGQHQDFVMFPHAGGEAVSLSITAGGIDPTQTRGEEKVITSANLPSGADSRGVPVVTATDLKRVSCLFKMVHDAYETRRASMSQGLLPVVPAMRKEVEGNFKQANRAIRASVIEVEAERETSETASEIPSRNREASAEQGSAAAASACRSVAPTEGGNVPGYSEASVKFLEFSEFCITITGAALKCVVDNHNLQVKFYFLCRLAASVIACRVTPKQKALLLKQNSAFNPRGTSLAIGDGANDVPMILAANVGVGVVGKEGLQATRSADFAVAEFRHLRRLLFVHGRESLRRNSSLVYFCVFVNVVTCLTQFLFNFVSGNSGAGAFNQGSRQTLNVPFLWIPIILYAVLDRQLPHEILEKHPLLYYAVPSKLWPFQRSTILEYLHLWFDFLLCGPARQLRRILMCRICWPSQVVQRTAPAAFWISQWFQKSRQPANIRSYGVHCLFIWLVFSLWVACVLVFVLLHTETGAWTPWNGVTRGYPTIGYHTYTQYVQLLHIWITLLVICSLQNTWTSIQIAVFIILFFLASFGFFLYTITPVKADVFFGKLVGSFAMAHVTTAYYLGFVINNLLAVAPLWVAMGVGLTRFPTPESLIAEQLHKHRYYGFLQDAPAGLGAVPYVAPQRLEETDGYSGFAFAGDSPLLILVPGLRRLLQTVRNSGGSKTDQEQGDSKCRQELRSAVPPSVSCGIASRDVEAHDSSVVPIV